MLTVYTKNHCPYCVRAKQYLDKLGIEYAERNIEEDSEGREYLIIRGHTTVPQIYLNGSLFVEGGCDGLIGLNEQQIRSRLAESDFSSLTL